MVEAVHEVALYIHRFHNLDLFEQGWYQIKLSMRWEDSACTSYPGSPSRVVQYDAFELGCDDILWAWRIDDMDHSFSSQPFHIRYARQDIFLCVMISFNLSLGKYKGPITSGVILKFELFFASFLKDRFSLQSSWVAGPSAVHEFRIPPKALLGLHSYCPVYFDAFHSVLVDTSVHISLLKGGSCSINTPSDPHGQEETANEKYNKTNQVVFVKALSTSHAILLEELKKLSNTINQTIDLTGFNPEHNETKLFSTSMQVGNTEASLVADKMQNDSEEPISSVGYNSDYLYSLKKNELSCLLHSLGEQIFYLWKTYLKFHRNNKTRILERLHDDWANDRRAEWSIWIVSSKVEVHHNHVGSQGDDDSINGVLGKARAFQKITQDPAEAAAMRAELHRHSIAQMKVDQCSQRVHVSFLMNSRSIQDLQIFGDPLRIPIIIIEHVVSAPFCSTSGNSCICNADIIDTHGLHSNFGSSFSCNQQKGDVLNIAVFVHGFQGNHLDLRLVRNQWLLIDPKMEILMSLINEDNTTGDFREMGLRLAQEVVSFIKKKKEKRSGGVTNIKLSFVGHSIGNIIIRTALTESTMEPYHKFLYAYISLSGPHLGYLYSSNSLFNSGLWLLKKLKNTRCIHQLTFTDDIDLQNTFFYKLCKQKTLESFKNIILLSSPQDGYVPYHSARIEMCQASLRDYSKTGQVYLEMLNNCLEQIRAPSTEQRMFMRCDVNFDVSLQESTMEPYHKFLYTYISLSGPHLGYLYSSNSLFNSGLWLLKKLKNTRCIHQLTFTDDIDLQNTFFYKLCKQKTLESFKNIILLSSPQDGYVPYQSARIEMCQASLRDYSKTGQVYLEMLNNCLEQIRAPSTEQRMFMRCDVNFDVSLQGRNLNTLIGRAAHIDFLETDTFIKFIMWSFPEFF